MVKIKKYLSHSANKSNEVHPLRDHLTGTALRMSGFCGADRHHASFKLTGLLHDLGKYRAAFQKYLAEGGRRGSVPHAVYGAGLARKIKQLEASFAIAGHHKGLPDRADWKNDTQEFQQNDNKDFCELVEIFRSDIGLLDDTLSCERIIFDDSFERELFTRYLFSSLTDADWLDTEAHFNPDVTLQRESRILEADVCIEKIDAAIAAKSRDGEINELRNAALDEAVRNSAGPPGFYSLNLPTGMGKTLTSFIWAVRHAKANGLKRIIIVLPYINIIEQTAEALKTILGEHAVLEHHSSYNENGLDTGESDNEGGGSADARKLATENWDYPVIVTTTVQFFESLFSNRPSKCRKVHNVSKSVVIFDEVQTLPKEMIAPTITMLKNVHAVMDVSFLFCTATQPALEKRENFDGVELIRPIVAEPSILFEKTRRVHYSLLNGLEPISIGELVQSVCGNHSSALVIFNTKKPTREFYESLKTTVDTIRIYHLSTAMCPDHRKKTIRKIREDLAASIRIIVSSTQLIEAGVDFDFPSVYRALAPMEGIIQAAGRCNREGKMSTPGTVNIFQLDGGRMPDKTYEACAMHSKTMIETNIDVLHRHDAYGDYYSRVISLYVNADKKNINEARKEFNFETVARAYRLMPGFAEGLFVYGYSEESKKLYHEIEFKTALSRDDFRRMQQFTVQVFPGFLKNNAGYYEAKPQGYTVWWGSYDSDTGLPVSPETADSYVV